MNSQKLRYRHLGKFQSSKLGTIEHLMRVIHLKANLSKNLSPKI